MPWLPAGGVPARVAVPLPLSLNVTPDGSAGVLVADRAAVGLPVVVTENVPACPAAKVVRSALVMTGAARAGLTVSVKLWVASGLTPLVAVMRDRVAARAAPARACRPGWPSRCRCR